MTAAQARADRTARREAVRDFKRQAILAAARTVFAEAGLDGATIRAIAERAGYAPGAIYIYYAGKEEIYAEILGDSLAQLAVAVKEAAAARGTPREAARRAALAFFGYYAERPDELELGLYLFQGARKRGLSPALDRRLNGRLIAVLQTMADALAAHGGLASEEANFTTVSLASHMVGCLIMERTGRLKVLGHEARRLVEDRIEETLDRIAA